MADPRVEKLAQVVTDHSIAVKPGDRVIISGKTVTAPLIQALFKTILKAGGHPYALAQIPEIEEIFYKHATDQQLQYLHQPLKLAYDTYDAGISIMGSANTKSLANVDPTKIKMARQARSKLLDTMLQRMATRDFRWLGTIFPTSANAQAAEMSLSAYEDFVFGACLPDEVDPIGYWEKFSAWQQNIVDWLDGKEKVHLLGPETDLRMSIAGRIFENCDGRENMPDGEVCVSPVETSVDGHVYFSYPGIYLGHEVQGVRLWFENGRVVKASADKGENFLHEILETDEGARTLGELGIGTNPGITKFTKNTLFDEKITGTFHLALGASFPDTGGVNKSAIHWDIVADIREAGEIWIDDVLFYKDGEFKD